MFLKVLDKYATVFDGKLGCYPDFEVELQLIDGAKPVFRKAYTVPHAYRTQFQIELYHLVKIGVLGPCGPSYWAFPTFIIPKKDMRIRWISDFRALNELILRSQYPLPLINELMQRHKRY